MAALVSDWAKNGARPFSNSMMTAVYELLPNSTDLTVHHQCRLRTASTLRSRTGWISTTPITTISPTSIAASVQHMGDQALGATRAFLASDWSGDKKANEIAYADIGSRIFVSLPQIFSLVLLGLCFGISAMMLVRPTRDGGWQKLDWRALALPARLPCRRRACCLPVATGDRAGSSRAWLLDRPSAGLQHGDLRAHRADRCAALLAWLAPKSSAARRSTPPAGSGSSSSAWASRSPWPASR